MISDGREHERVFYQSVVGPGELDRVMNPKSAADELLRLKADAILDNIRVLRVKIARAQLRDGGKQGLLFKEYEADFDKYIKRLPDYERITSEMIPADYILAPSTDAMCVETACGNVIIISEVLRYFLYFMNLANLDLPSVSASVRGHARIIAVRTMFLAESLDFDLDPRGSVPAEIDEEVRGMVDWQLQWLIGHELAHHYLNHVGYPTEGSLYSSALSVSRTSLSERSIFARSWEQEFEADLHSISVPNYQHGERYSIIIGALMTLSYVAMFERVAEYVDPELKCIDTHPSTEDRIFAIVHEFGEAYHVHEDDVRVAFQWHMRLADEMIDILKKDSGIFSRYGSVYLAEWQGPSLRDRIDY